MEDVTMSEVDNGSSPTAWVGTPPGVVTRLAARRAARRAALHYLLTGDKLWERLEATVIVAKSAADAADGEAVLMAECSRAGRSVEVIAAGNGIRIYRIGVRA